MNKGGWSHVDRRRPLGLASWTVAAYPVVMIRRFIQADVMIPSRAQGALKVNERENGRRRVDMWTMSEGSGIWPVIAQKLENCFCLVTSKN